MGEFINFLGNNLADFWTYTGFANATVGHIVMILIGLFFIYLAVAKEFEPMLLIPIGFGILIGNIPFNMEAGLKVGIYEEGSVLNILYQGVTSGWYPPLIFLGIGAMTDFSALISNPKLMLIGAAAQFGIFGAYMIALAMGFDPMQAGAIGIIGGADGPMVLFTSLALAKHLFVPITVVAYLYLGLTYGGYPYLVKLLVPKRFRAIKMVTKKAPKNYDAKVKLAFSAVLCAVLCFLFPVASPLFFSLFLGVAVRESGMKHIYDFVSGPLLYGSTFMLGVLLGVLCDAHLLLDPKILKLLVLGIVALLLSGIGGIIGGYIMYIVKRGNYNPVVGIAAVSCVPTTAKVAQKIVSKDNPDSFVLGDALGANISGVITSAIITGIYITIIPYL
jgi:sodium ion-translocating decarboxylase beta subunit